MQTPIPILKLTTPIGTAKYPWITEPDTKFNPDGEYRVELIMESSEETASLLDKLSSFRDQSVAEYKRAGGGKAIKVAPHFPMSTLEDGTISIKAKLKAKVTTKTGRSWDQRPALFDARGVPIANDIRLGSGSRMRLSLEVSSFNAPAIGGVGISLRLRGVQVIEVREPRATSATDFGFGAEETGFVTETFDTFDDDAITTKKASAAVSTKKAGKVDF